jgi:EAL domain-containing protein (putative c-di-GMP-specific phosphodiesterase class I)/GGDEF domain-containing protein
MRLNTPVIQPISDIQETNLLISDLSSSEHFYSEISRKIIVRSNLVFGLFNLVLAIILAPKALHSVDSLGLIAALVINCAFALGVSYKGNLNQKIPNYATWILDFSTIITILLLTYTLHELSFYYLIVSLFFFNVSDSNKSVLPLSILSILGFGVLYFLSTPLFATVEAALQLMVCCIVLFLVGYLRVNLEEIIVTAKKITERLEEISSNLADRLDEEKHARLFAEEFDTETSLYNIATFQKLLERELFLFSLNHEENHEECLINLYIHSLENQTQTLSLANQSFLFMEIGNRLRNLFGSTWLIGRASKNEFVLFNKAREIGKNILDYAHVAQSDLQRPFFIDGLPIYLDIKCGVAQESVRSADELLRHARIASLYSIERSIDSPILFDGVFEEIVSRNDAILRQIRHAIDQSSFELFLHPVTHLSSKRILKAEALIRLKDIDGSYIPPSQFIPLAQRNGLVTEITQWVMRQSCRQLAILREEFHPAFEMSINVSPSDLHRPTDFLSLIDEVIEENKLPYDAITLEITEGIILDINTPVKDVLNTLRALGIKISLDDFGTGYSSLSYLDQLPIDYLKIDQSFIQEISENSNKYAICNGIIDISHSLNIAVIAEGIETTEQMALLERIHCDYGQGYLFSKPIFADDFLKHINLYYES